MAGIQHGGNFFLCVSSLSTNAEKRVKFVSSKVYRTHFFFLLLLCVCVCVPAEKESGIKMNENIPPFSDNFGLCRRRAKGTEAGRGG